MPKLIVSSSANPGSSWTCELKPHENTLGRSVQNDIVLPSIYASRQHAVLVVEPAFITITDLGSQNGTFVNGARIEVQSLVDGDVIAIGGCEMRLVAGEQEYSEVEARGLASVPHWMMEEHARDLDADAPTAPDSPKSHRGKL